MRERAVGGVLSVVTLAALAATGTRGAWIGAAGVIGCSLLVAAWRWVRGRTGRAAKTGAKSNHVRAIAITAALAVVCGTAVWLAAGETIAARVRETRTELARAMDGDYSTFTGARLAMWGWAGRAFAEHPVRGVGAGGYKAWVEASQRGVAEAGEPRVDRPMVHGHAHSTFIHAAAVTGGIGVALLVGLIAVCVRNGLRDLRGRYVWGYDAGPAIALLGLVFVGLFDSIQVNQQTAYWMWVLVAMCMLRRPSATGENGGEE